MRRFSGILPAAAILLAGLSGGRSTMAAGVQNALPVRGTITMVPQARAVIGESVPVSDTRTEKQKALAEQTARLFDMATELKVQVDKTNKNILSLKVVEKAEEIETLARSMRSQVRR